MSKAVEGKTLIYITNHYPFGGTTEEAFMKSEIQVLSRTFPKVVVMPVRKAADCLDISCWPDNVSLDAGITEQKRIQGRWRYVYLLHPCLALAILRDCRVLLNRKLLCYLTESFQEGLAVKRRCSRLARSLGTLVFYTFWFAEASIGLGMIPKRKGVKWISRAHRYDLYDDCVPIRSRFFRNMAFRNLDKVLSCSHHGQNYLSARYPRWKDKIGTLYLGTSRPARIPEYSTCPDTVRFITVARLEPVKRPLSTFRILNELAGRFPEKTFKWTVAGGGSQEGQLKGLAANESRNNLEVELLGETPNAEVHRLLESQPFDWMIMLSESEGLPISFAEAMSYGIPVIATDVGGVREEVITGETGILLSAEPSAGELESALCPFFSDIACFLQLRSSTSDFWKANLEESALKRELADILSC